MAELRAILADESKLLEIIREELLEVKTVLRINAERKLQLGGAEMIEDEDLNPS